jgi:hypothetical protein
MYKFQTYPVKEVCYIQRQAGVKVAAATNKLHHHNSKAEHICLLC